MLESVAREAVAKQIDHEVTKEEKRKSPSLKKIKSLQAEREALGKGDLPRWAEAKQGKQIAEANKKLRASLVAMRTTYIQAKDLAKADAIDEEILELVCGAKWL